jgi:hypothetical protein
LEGVGAVVFFYFGGRRMQVDEGEIASTLKMGNNGQGVL